MAITSYHAKYYAYELTRRCPADSEDRLASALVDAQVDLNPHQIDASLFAFRSPLSRGVLLADEVGLGKTIEAGLVLAQKWAERKRRMLVIGERLHEWHRGLMRVDRADVTRVIGQILMAFGAHCCTSYPSPNRRLAGLRHRRRSAFAGFWIG